MATNFLSSVSIAPLSTRPFYVPGMENDPEDMFDVISVGPPFQYVVPSFEVLAVEIRQIKITGQQLGVIKNYDLFIRNDSSICRAYPARMAVKDVVVIEVNTF